MNTKLTRRFFNSSLFLSGAAAVLSGGSTGKLFAEAITRGEGEKPFLHPGMLQSAEDLTRMRDGVARREQPVYSGFEALRNDPHSQLTYQPSGAFEEIGRNPTVHSQEFDDDSSAAYQCALIGHIAGEKAYLQLTATILDRWATKLRRITGADAILCAGLGGFKMANAAELLRHSEVAWPESSALRFGDMLQEVFVPVLHTFAPFANGNWDAAAMKTLMAIAIYQDDWELFEKVLVYYNHGCGDGKLENYIYANGQCQESGRDQQHTQLGLAHMGDCCEMALHQGLDLYGMANNRLLDGFEYTAKYILGVDVPFVSDVDKTGQYQHTVISPRSPLRPVYEQIYNHYNKRRGLPAPWVAKAVSQVRPEGPGFHADHTGFGTLLYSRVAGPQPVVAETPGRPSGLHAGKDQAGTLQLSWVPTTGAGGYVLLRRDESTGASRRFESASPMLTDHAVEACHRYRYQVHLNNRERRTSSPISVVAGLPTGWTTPEPDWGVAIFDGQRWQLSTAGNSFFNVSTRLVAGQVFMARLSRQFASQFLKAGLELRDHHGIARFIVEPTNMNAGRGWSVRLYTAQARDGQLSMIDEVPLARLFLSYNRIDNPLWFRLGIEARHMIAAFSGDGVRWTSLKPLPREPSTAMQCGLTASSGIENVGAEILMDEVKVGWFKRFVPTPATGQQRDHS